jgi:UDP-glucose 4-epimerase
MRLLVTGGAGYIGSIVSRQLLASGYEVVVFDNLERGHEGAVPPGATLVVADLTDAEAVRGLVSDGFDGVVHLAALALVGESVSHPERYYRTNVHGSFNLLEAMRESQVERLVFSSTCAVYGQPDEVPISESAPPRPPNAYGASKLAVDQMTSAFSLAHGIAAVSLRYFNVAGASGGAGEDHEPETHLIPTSWLRRLACAQASIFTAPITRHPTERRFATTSTSMTWRPRICWRSVAHGQANTRSSISATAAASPYGR